MNTDAGRVRQREERRMNRKHELRVQRVAHWTPFGETMARGIPLSHYGYFESRAAVRSSASAAEQRRNNHEQKSRDPETGATARGYQQS